MPRAALSVVLASLVAAASAAPARAENAAAPGKDVAKRLFEEGVDLEKKSDYVGALAKYHEAEQITVTAGLHFHVAFCLEMTQKLAAALDAYETAQKLARDQNKPDVEKAVATRLEPLRARVPLLAVRLATPAAKDVEVQVDGTSLAAVLLDGRAFRVDPGAHTITARATGYAPFVKRIDAPLSVTTTVDVALEPEGVGPSAAGATGAAGAVGAAGAATPEPPAEARKGRSRVVPIALGVGAVAFLAGGAAFFVSAGGSQSDAKRDCPAKPSCDDARKDVRTLDALALTGFVGAAGLGALAVITWTSSGPGHATTTTPTATTTTTSHARLVATPTSLRFEGAF